MSALGSTSSLTVCFHALSQNHKLKRIEIFNFIYCYIKIYVGLTSRFVQWTVKDTDAVHILVYCMRLQSDKVSVSIGS